MSMNRLAKPSEPVKQGKALSGISIIYLVIVGGMIGISIAVARNPNAINILSRLFALDSQQLFWYMTRAAGVIAYLLLWLSTAWGIAIPAKIFDSWLDRTFTFDFHQFISLLSIGFIVLHVAVLMFDRYLPYSLAQILIPFRSTYRPFWIGIGVIAMYLTILVTITFYIRQYIGMKAFRAIHLSSMLAYFGSLAHSFFSGTDSSLPMAYLMYLGSFLVIVFLFAYWLFSLRLNRRDSNPVDHEVTRSTLVTKKKYG